VADLHAVLRKQTPPDFVKIITIYLEKKIDLALLNSLLFI